MKKFIFLSIVLFTIQFGYTQVGINTTNPDAQLHIKSSNQVTPANNDGILIPRIDAFPITNPTIAQNSMMVYLTTLSAGKQPGFYFWDNGTTSWKGIDGDKGWSLTGNSGTNPATNFIGTTDNNDLVFKRFNLPAGKISVSNTSLGINSLVANTGFNNVGIGTSTLNSNSTGGDNTAVGVTAMLSNSIGSNNSAFGYGSLNINSLGNNNTAIGTSTLFGNTGSDNTALGYQSGNSNSSGSNNLTIGNNSNVPIGSASNQLSIANVIYGSDLNSTATGKIGIGVAGPTEKLEVAGKTKTTNLQVTTGAALNNLLVSDAIGNATWQSPNTTLNSFAWKTTGNSGTNPATNFIGTTDDIDVVFKRFNIFAGQLRDLTTSFGLSALEVNTGLNNVAFGSQSLKSNTTGSNNAALGHYSLGANTIGSSNFAIGYNALGSNRTASSNIAIGANCLSGQNFLNGGIAFYTDNIGIGIAALGQNNPTNSTNGNKNLAIGTLALGANSIGSNNIAFGYNSLLFNKVGSNNIAFGTQALFKQNFTNAGAVYDADNVAIGYQALYNTNSSLSTNGIGNIGIGKYTLSNNTTGSNNIALGYSSLGAGWSNPGTMTGNNNVAIGYAAVKSLTSGVDNIGLGTLSLGYNNVGNENVSIGKDALYYSTALSNGTAIGTRAMRSYGFTAPLGVNDNVAIGYEALRGLPLSPIPGHYNQNTAVGYQAITSITSGSANTGIGYLALTKNTSGIDNTSTGSNSLHSNTTGNQNTAVGSNVLYENISGVDNSAVGYSSLYSNDTGSQNTAVGSNSLYENTSGNFNTAVGFASLQKNDTGYYNVAIGHNAIYSNTSGYSNTAIGGASLYKNTTGYNNVANGLGALNANISGNSNTAIGYLSLYTNSTGSQNVAVGSGAMYKNSTGQYNTVLGRSALFSNDTGESNIAIGDYAGYNETGSNKLYIENSNSANPLIYGDFAVDLIRINGNVEVDNLATTNNKMQLVNKNNFVHNNGNQIFGNGGDDFILSSKEGASDTGGIYGDGNAITIWSPGDGNQGQAAALVYFMDEDNFDGTNTNPYDNSALKSYISPAGAYVQISDKNKKENIAKIENASEKINQISGYTYQFKLAPNEIAKGDKPIKSSGVLAQEVEKILPEAVQKNDNGDYFVDYAAITPLLIEALKDQNIKIKNLETVNAEILKRLEKLENK